MKLSEFELSKDDSGRPRATTSGSSKSSAIVCSFLRSDIQDPSHARHLLQAAHTQAQSRGAHRYTTTGNAYAVSIGRNTVLIRPLLPDSAATPIAKLPRTLFESLLKRWITLLS